MIKATILSPPISINLPLQVKWHFSLKAFWTLTIVSIISLLFFYIFQVNFLTKEAYLIQDYQKKLANLSLENENLEINFSKSNSLANIENYFSNQNFEKANPGQIKYTKILESEIVTK